jgi:hypothetical protein
MLSSKEFMSIIHKVLKNKRTNIQCSILIIIILVTLFLLFSNYIYFLSYSLYSIAYIERDFHLKSQVRNYSSRRQFREFTSPCECRRNDEKVHLTWQNDQSYSVKILTDTGELKKEYKLGKSFLETNFFSCSWYNSLRRGPNQKVISYSLYGRNQFYYRFIKNIAKMATILYPEWTIRIHYDNSISTSAICEIECLKYSHADDDDGREGYLDNVDFCDVERLPFDFATTWNASFMHG